jgi:asparagine synthase (glutamine-hydrolysing)
MCGIAGIYSRERDAVSDSGCVQRMLDAIEHRGPDGEGIVEERGAVLGHRRLAIIDPSDRGAQPMSDWTGRFVITYNGEIYNYVELRTELERLGARFASSCDTEVLVNAFAVWGPGCLQRLNGQFAFAIYDRATEELFCARDRLGIKPFAYVDDGRRFAFASEPKALLGAGLAERRLDPDAVYSYIARGHADPRRSLYSGIRNLAPGHLLHVTRRGLSQTAWWSPSDRGAENADVPVEQIAALLSDAVRLSMRSDVGVGAYLSGGLDSSAVLALAAGHTGGDVVALTGAFAGAGDLDERPFAREVAAMHRVRHHEVEIELDDLPRQFDRLIWHLDEPIAGPGAFPQLMVSDLAARADLKVVLGGQGGDELFGGYLRHRAAYQVSRLRSGRIAPTAAAGLDLLRLALAHGRRVRQTASRVRDADLSPAFLERVDPQLRAAARSSTLRTLGPAELLTRDLTSYLPALLAVEDRVSMAASIESRVPLLDHRLVELITSLPPERHFSGRASKPLLRSAAASHLPASVVARTGKNGFATPLDRWRRHPALSELVGRATASPRDRSARSLPEIDGENEVFSQDFLASSRSFTASRLWTVLAVQGWLSQLESGTAEGLGRGLGAGPSRLEAVAA